MMCLWCAQMRESRDFFPVFRWRDEGTVGPADSLPDQGYLLLERENHPESADTEGRAHTHKDTCKGIQQFYLWCTHMRTHRSPQHMRTLPKRLNRLIAGTPLRKQQPNYHHILHQGQHTHIHHFTCANHTPLLLTKPLGSNKSS